MPKRHYRNSSPLRMKTWFEPKPGVRARFWNAGHLLGSASIELEITEDGKPIRMMFSGDLGPEEKAFHPEPDAPNGYDYIMSVKVPTAIEIAMTTRWRNAAK